MIVEQARMSVGQTNTKRKTEVCVAVILDNRDMSICKYGIF